MLLSETLFSCKLSFGIAYIYARRQPKKKKKKKKVSLGILDRGVQFSYFVFIHNFIRFFTYRLNSADVFKE